MSALGAMQARRVSAVPGVPPVHVREMSASDMMSLQEAQGLGGVEIAIRVVAICACDESGAALFSGDAEHVREMPWRVIEAVSHAALELNGLSGDGTPGN